MEACFYHRIKKVINTFYLKIQTICLRIDRAVRNNWRILTFFLEFSYISQFWPFSLNSEFASWLLFICELKSHSYFFIIFILWQKETSIVFTSSCKGRCWSSLSLCLNRKQLCEGITGFSRLVWHQITKRSTECHLRLQVNLIWQNCSLYPSLVFWVMLNNHIK